MAERVFANAEWARGFTGAITAGDLPSAIRAVQALRLDLTDVETNEDFARHEAWGYVKSGTIQDPDDRRRVMIGAVLCAEIVEERGVPQAKFVLPGWSTKTYQVLVPDAINMIHGLIGAAQFGKDQHVTPWDTNASAVSTIDRLHASMMVAQGFGALPGFRSLVSEYHSQLTQPLTAFGRTRKAV